MGTVQKPVHIAGQDFTDAIDRCGLPLKLDTPTQGDGNCWVRAVQQQLERPELEQQLNSRTRKVMSVRKSERYMVLKKSIAEFATSSQNPTIRRAKGSFEYEGQGAVDRVTWENHWRQLARDGEWSDELMVQATAWFTGHDIQLVMTTSTPEEPFKIFRGNLEDSEKDCLGLPLWIGYQNNIHYQSLLPTDEEVAYQQPEQEGQNNKILREEKECPASKTQRVETVERDEKNKRPGDKIPTKIRKKKANRIEGEAEVKKAEGNKKPGDKIPTKIKEMQAAQTEGGEAVERGEMKIKPGDKIPTQIKKEANSKVKRC